MSSVSISELILLFVIGLLILGPERLPRVARQIGRWVGRARRTANQLRYQLEREVALSEFEQAKKPEQKSRAKPGQTEPSAPPAASAATGATASPASAGDAAPDAATTTDSVTDSDTDTVTDSDTKSSATPRPAASDDRTTGDGPA